MIKQRSYLRLFNILLLTGYLVSCNNDDDAPPPVVSNCQVSKVISNAEVSERLYDPAGRVTQINHQKNGQLSDYQVFEYNAAGQPTQVTDFKQTNVAPERVRYTVYEYNNDNRRTKETVFTQLPGAAAFIDVSYTSYEYDAARQLTKATYFTKTNNAYAKSGSTAITYDDQGDIVKQISYDAQDEEVFTAKLEYDNRPNVLQYAALDYIPLPEFNIAVAFSAHNFTKVTINAMAPGVPIPLVYATLTNTFTTNPAGLISSIESNANSLFDPSLNQSASTTLEYACK